MWHRKCIKMGNAIYFSKINAYSKWPICFGYYNHWAMPGASWWYNNPLFQHFLYLAIQLWLQVMWHWLPPFPNNHSPTILCITLLTRPGFSLNTPSKLAIIILSSFCCSSVNFSPCYMISLILPLPNISSISGLGLSLSSSRLINQPSGSCHTFNKFTWYI